MNLNIISSDIYILFSFDQNEPDKLRCSSLCECTAGAARTVNNSQPSVGMGIAFGKAAKVRLQDLGHVVLRGLAI